jgi:hypothetical protein
MTESNDISALVKEIQDFVEAAKSRGAEVVAIQGPGEPQASVLITGYDKVLLAEALSSATRAEDAGRRGDSRAEAGATAAAVLCAAAACEAKLSEYLAHWEFVAHETPAEISRIRTNPDARYQWKELLAHRAPGYDCGTSKQFLALGCLFRVRDHIAHRHARSAALGSFPDRLDDCIRQGVIPVRRSKGLDWTSVIFLNEIGRWAANAAGAWLGEVSRMLPRPTMC